MNQQPTTPAQPQQSPDGGPDGDPIEYADAGGSASLSGMSDAGGSAAQSGASAAASAAASGSQLPSWLGKRVGRFRLVSLLGRGTWGRVFEAEDEQLRRRVALKLLPTKATGKGKNRTAASDITRVASEARAAASMEHPNVVQIYEIGERRDFLFLAMELAEGGSVDELIKATGPMDAARACTICAEAGDALALAHECGITHRDVKPGNLLLSRSGRCKVADFGLAAGGDVSNPLHATRAAGTAHYIAPEIVVGSDATPRSDVYSLGATLYHMLAGRRPFAHIEGRANVLRAQLRQEPPPLGELRPDLEAKLVGLINRAMAKDPANRPADMRTFARGLRLFTVPVSQRPAEPAPAPAPAKKRSRWPLAAAGLLAAAAVAAAIGFALWQRGDFGESEQLAVAPPPAVTATGTSDLAPAVPGMTAEPPANLPPIKPAPPIATPEPERDGPPAAGAEPTPPNVTPQPPQNAAAPAEVDYTFRLDVSGWNDRPQNAYVVGDFNGWSEQATPLVDPDGDGVLAATLPVEPGLHHYKFLIDRGTENQRWLNDPGADRGLEVDDGFGGKNSGVRVGA